ncbi:unnamed protein product [Taenia asiatica]|uniref:Uncharacterized protein n=1 Tax=Taenia asiatica TaxID=60517 RepID=A0A0R3WFA2_TAEAS|nr:unnamed protein product [Taenia asiatica]
MDQQKKLYGKASTAGDGLSKPGYLLNPRNEKVEDKLEIIADRAKSSPTSRFSHMLNRQIGASRSPDWRESIAADDELEEIPYI